MYWYYNVLSNRNNEWESNFDSAEIVHAALDLVITDHADRKMVAGVLAAGGRSGGCTLVNSCDTDWYDWQSALEDADVFVDLGSQRLGQGIQTAGEGFGLEAGKDTGEGIMTGNARGKV